MKKLFRHLLWHILGMYLLLITYVSLSEFEIIPVHIVSNPYAQYLLDVLTFAAIVAGVYFTLRLFSMQRIQEAFEMATTEERQLQVYRRWSLRRQYFIWGCLSACTLVYYLSEHSNSAIYGMLILLLANLFCLPSVKEFHKTFA